MSDSFQDREKSFEAKHKQETELQFRAEARRNKLVGLWAAEKMGLKDADADAYAKTVVLSDLQEPGVNDVVGKIMADFAERKVAVSEEDVRLQLKRQMVVAIEQVKENFTPLGDDHG
jgi:hypothetical protein